MVGSPLQSAGVLARRMMRARTPALQSFSRQVGPFRYNPDMTPRHLNRRRSFAQRLMSLATPVIALAIAGPVIAADEPSTSDSRPAAARPAAADNRVLVLLFSAEGGD